MKKSLSVLTILFIVTSCFVIAFAQPRKKNRIVNANRGVTRTGSQQQSIIGAGAGAGSVYRTSNGRRGRYVTRNGKRIWVPQGSPAVGNRPTTNRNVVEREQLDAVKTNKPTSNTNRP